MLTDEAVFGRIIRTTAHFTLYVLIIAVLRVSQTEDGQELVTLLWTCGALRCV